MRYGFQKGIDLFMPKWKIEISDLSRIQKVSHVIDSNIAARLS
jgi:hypothetical protein